MHTLLSKKVSVPMRVLLPVLLAVIALFSILAFQPNPDDRYGQHADGSYWQSMDYVVTGHYEPWFLANRFVTGSGFIVTVVAMEKVLGSREVAWLLLNSLFFIGMGCVFYALALRILKDTRAAFLSTLLLVLNYAAIVS